MKDRIDRILKKIEELDRKSEIRLILLLFFLITGVVMLLDVGLNAGYHLVDDHELLAHEYLIRVDHQSFFDVVKLNIGFDVDLGRWRPLYRFLRVLEAVVIGQKLWIFYLWEFVRVFLVFFLLYLIGRELGANMIWSFLFPSVVLMGYQAAAWWKLGPQEMFSMLLFAGGMYFLIRNLKTKNRKDAFVSGFLFLLMSLYKEAFVLCIPFLMLLILYYELREEETLSVRMLWDGGRKHVLWFCYLALIMLGNLYVIVFLIGTQNMGDSSSSFIEPYLESVTHDLKWYALFGTVFFAVTVSFGKKCRVLFRELILCLSLILPQYVLYGKRAIEERYLLPMSVGFGLMYLIFVPKKLRLKGIRFMIYAAALLLLLGAHARLTLREGEYYRFRGQSVTSMLDLVRTMSKEDPELKVLSCLYPMIEGDWTVADYNLVEGLDNVYYYSEDNGGTVMSVVDPEASMIPGARAEVPGDLSDMGIIVKYNELDRHWCYNPTFDKSGYRKIKCGTLDIFIRNDITVPVPEIRIRDTLFHFDYVTTVNPEDWN